MWRGRKNLFIVTNRAGKVTEKLGAGQRLAAYGLTHTEEKVAKKIGVGQELESYE